MIIETEIKLKIIPHFRILFKYILAYNYIKEESKICR